MRIFTSSVLCFIAFSFGCADQKMAQMDVPTASAPVFMNVSASGEPSGAVKVDSACGGSDSFTQIDREDNTINPGSTAVAWMNAPKGLCGNYHYTIFQNGSHIIAQAPLTFTCSGNYCRAYFTAPASPSGALNLLVESDCIGVIGADSFRLISNSSCVK